MPFDDGINWGGGPGANGDGADKLIETVQDQGDTLQDFIARIFEFLSELWKMIF
jgi:hypothetical protein